MKRELILESPNLLLHGEIKIFIPDIHRTSYGHLKVWSKIDKIDLSGIATQNYKLLKMIYDNSVALRLRHFIDDKNIIIRFI